MMTIITINMCSGTRTYNVHSVSGIGDAYMNVDEFVCFAGSGTTAAARSG